MIMSRRIAWIYVLIFLSGLVWKAQAIDPLRPGQDILAWAQAVEEETMRSGIILDVKGSRSGNVSAGAVIHPDDILTVDMKGADAGKCDLTLHVDDDLSLTKMESLREGNKITFPAVVAEWKEFRIKPRGIE